MHHIEPAYGAAFDGVGKACILLLFCVLCERVNRAAGCVICAARDLCACNPECGMRTFPQTTASSQHSDHEPCLGYALGTDSSNAICLSSQDPSAGTNFGWSNKVLTGPRLLCSGAFTARGTIACTVTSRCREVISA